MPFDRDQAKHLKRRFQIAAIIGGHRGQRQAQMRGIGRDHHPGPRALPRILALVARAQQRLAVDGDHVTVAEQGRDLGQHPPESSVQRLRVDHPEHRREGVVRWDGMPELQEVSERMLFCPTEVPHLGTIRRPQSTATKPTTSRSQRS